MKYVAATKKTKEDNVRILDFGRFFFCGDETSVAALAKPGFGAELPLVEDLECHDVKSCRCIVALKAAASFKSFDIVVRVKDVA